MIDVSEYLPLAHTIAYAVWRGGGSSEDLDDLKGQAGLIMVKAARSFDPARGTLKKHLTYRVRYDLLDYIRKRRTKIPPTVEQLNALHDIVAKKPDTAMAKILADEQLADALRGVGFTYKQRAVFNRVRRGQSQVEISKGLKLTEGRVSQLWKRAIIKVQKHLKNKRRPVAYCLNCGEKLKGRTHSYKQQWFCSRDCSAARSHNRTVESKQKTGESARKAWARHSPEFRSGVAYKGWATRRAKAHDAASA